MWQRIKGWGNEAGGFLWQAILDYGQYKGPRHAAALAFYSVFSLAPLLVVAVATVGFVFGDEAARGEVFAELRLLTGPELAGFIQDMVAQAKYGGGGVIATVIGLATLFYGSSRIFNALQDALNLIWQVPPSEEGGGFGAFLKNLFLSLALVPTFGLLFLVFVISSTIVSGVGDWLEQFLSIPRAVTRLTDVGVSLVFITVMFMILFKVLPNKKLSWRQVGGGAFVTAALFVLGKSLIGFYLARASAGSIFGAAGTLAVLLMWLYLSAQIFFFGATLTHVWAQRYDDLEDEEEQLVEGEQEEGGLSLSALIAEES